MVKVWSTKFYKCINCRKTKYNHVSKGLCSNCYHRFYAKKLRLKKGMIPRKIWNKAWTITQDKKIFNSCSECKRNDIRPGGYGLCENCYARWYRKK